MPSRTSTSRARSRSRTNKTNSGSTRSRSKPRTEDSSSSAKAEELGIGDRVREAYNISKEHMMAAMKNQSQGGADVMAGRASASNVASVHSHEAMEDMKQWKNELGQAFSGDKLPKEAHVREIPPMHGDHPSRSVVKKKQT